MTDGRGLFYEGIIVDADAHQCGFDIHSTYPEPQRNFRIHIGVSPTKNTDRIEWFVEKAVEFGIDEISIVICDHTERQNLKLDRLHKMAVSAMKQSLKASLPVIHPLTDIRTFIKGYSEFEKFIASVDPDNNQLLQSLVIAGRPYVVLIGPEGDFSREELLLAESKGYRKISLGPSRLRTETAAIAACHILNLANTP